MKLIVATLMLAALSASCTAKQPPEYKTYIVLGRMIKCSSAKFYYCGVHLTDCDGDAFEIYCATNVVELKGLSQ